MWIYRAGQSHFLQDFNLPNLSKFIKNDHILRKLSSNSHPVVFGKKRTIIGTYPLETIIKKGDWDTFAREALFPGTQNIHVWQSMVKRVSVDVPESWPHGVNVAVNAELLGRAGILDET